ncbi:hypothetical protein KKG29_05400 [Patescibacteria group bacterium]|nr:hypothetical protein [Patescibacteria group bacterium]
MEYSCSQYSNAFPGYLENTVSKPFYHSDLKNTLEGIVFKETPEKQQGILEKMFSDKGKTLKGTVKALLNEIKLRETLDSHLIKKIDDEVCSKHTDLMQLNNLKLNYSPDLARDINTTKMQLENSVLELEKEKRKEYLECWRDLMFLKKYLLTSLKDYWDLVNKRNVLSYDLNS